MKNTQFNENIPKIGFHKADKWAHLIRRNKRLAESILTSPRTEHKTNKASNFLKEETKFCNNLNKAQGKT